MVLLSRPNSIRELVENAFSGASLKPQPVAEINAPGLLMEAVKAQLGYTILPACALKEGGDSKQVDAIELEGGSMRRSVLLSTSRLFCLSPAADCVYQILLQLMKAAASDTRWNATLITSSNDEVR